MSQISTWWQIVKKPWSIQSISYMGGTLWAEVAGGGLQLDFLPGDNIFPFSYLVIKVVIV